MYLQRENTPYLQKNGEAYFHVYICDQQDLTRSFKIKNPACLRKLEEMLARMREILTNIDIKSGQYTIDDIVQIIKTGEDGTKPIDFLEFSKNWIEEASIKGKKNYVSALNSFIKFYGNKPLTLKQLTPSLLIIAGREACAPWLSGLPTTLRNGISSRLEVFLRG